MAKVGLFALLTISGLRQKITKEIFMNYLSAFLFISLFLAPGCTTAPSDSQQLAASMAIKYATIRVIERADDQSSAATRIIEIAEQAQKMVDSGTITLVDDLVRRIRERIDWDEMNYSRRFLAEALLEATSRELQQRIQGGSLNPETVVVLSLVLKDIVFTARTYAQ